MLNSVRFKKLPAKVVVTSSWGGKIVEDQADLGMKIFESDVILDLNSEDFTQLDHVVKVHVKTYNITDTEPMPPQMSHTLSPLTK